MYIRIYVYTWYHIYTYIYIERETQSTSRSPPGQVLGLCCFCSFVIRCVTVSEFCIIFDTLSRPWSVFWSHFCYFIVIVGVLWVHFLHKGFDWSAKAVPGGAKGQNANIKPFFWSPFSTYMSDIFKTRTTFSMSFRSDVLVMLSACVRFLKISPPMSLSM